MLFFVISGRSDTDKAIVAARTVRDLSLPVVAYAIGRNWVRGAVQVYDTLHSASHIIVVLPEEPLSSGWVPFVAGLAMGSSRPLILYGPHPPYLENHLFSQFYHVDSTERLQLLLQANASEWFSSEQRKESWRDLLASGVSFREESFADAVRNGDERAVTLFLKAGLGPDSRDRRGVPILCLAAREGNLHLVHTLLSAGASPSLQSEDRGYTALMDAVAGGHEGIVAALLSAGCDVEAKSKDGQTALVLAVGRHDVSAVRLLLEAGANPDAEDKLGFSAKKYASLFHDAAVLSLFAQA